MIAHSKTSITELDLESTRKCLSSGMVASGEGKDRLLAAVQDKYQCKGVAATSSGRGALYLILAAIGLKAGDSVIMPTYVCQSVLMTVKSFGAEPVIVDVDNSYSIEIDAINQKINKSVKAIIAVHTFGIAGDLQSLVKLSKSSGVALIEDCSHSVGGSIDEKLLGTFGDYSFFSLQGTKVLTSGEGGIAILNNEAFKDQFTKAIKKYNSFFPLSDMASALALSQFSQLDTFLENRSSIASFYNESLRSVASIALPAFLKDQPVFFRYVVWLDGDFEALKNAMQEKGVAIRKGVDTLLHHIEGNSDCPHADTLFLKTVSLPIYPALTSIEAKQVVDSLKESLQ